MGHRGGATSSSGTLGSAGPVTAGEPVHLWALAGSQEPRGGAGGGKQLTPGGRRPDLRAPGSGRLLFLFPWLPLLLLLRGDLYSSPPPSPPPSLLLLLL